MKHIILFLLILIGLNLNSQSVLSNFAGYANTANVSGTGPNYTLDITDFVGNVRFEPYGQYLATDIQIGDVLWVNCTRLVITGLSLQTATFANIVVQVPSGDWALGVSGPINSQRVAIVRENSLLPTLPQTGDGNGGVISGISNDLFTCMLNHYQTSLVTTFNPVNEIIDYIGIYGQPPAPAANLYTGQTWRNSAGQLFYSNGISWLTDAETILGIASFENQPCNSFKIAIDTVGIDTIYVCNNSVFRRLATSASISIPTNQIVYGTGTSVTSENAFVWNPTTNSLGINTSTPQHPIHIIDNTRDPAILITGTYTGTTQGHSITDTRSIANADSYASFYAANAVTADIIGPGEHYAGFQTGLSLAAPRTIEDYYGFSDNVIGLGTFNNYYAARFYGSSSGTIGTYRGVQVSNVNNSANTIGFQLDNLSGSSSARGLLINNISGPNANGIRVTNVTGTNSRPLYTQGLVEFNSTSSAGNVEHLEFTRPALANNDQQGFSFSAAGFYLGGLYAAESGSLRGDLVFKVNPSGSSGISNLLERARLRSNGVFDVQTGFRINNTATLGNVLRADGTNFISAKLLPSDLAQQSATTGQVIKWDGTQWSPSNDNNNIYTAGTGISIASNVITNTGDLSNTNEIQTYSHSGTTNYVNSLSSGGGSFTLQAAGIASINTSGNVVTIGAVETDGSTTNEGILSVGAGAANSSVLQSNTSGNPGTIFVAGTGLSISETTSSGGSITYTNTGDTNPSDDVTTAGLTTNYVPKANGSNFLQNSAIFDNAGNIGIGTTSPSHQLTTTQDVQFNGVRVGRGNSSLISNTAVGSNALNAVTTAEDCVAIGQNALSTMTTGGDNVAVGKNAMSGATGTTNIAIGKEVLQSVTGNYNVGIGSVSLKNVTSGSGNVGLGTSSLNNVSTGSNNFGLGFYSLFSVNTGQNNIGIGTSSASSITNQSDLIAIGANALQNSTGIGGIGIGSSALRSATGNYNVGIGISALYALTTGTQNMAIGASGLSSETTGSQNVAIGAFAGSSQSGASFNTFIGASSGGSTTTGSQNLGIGALTLGAITTQSSNIAIGAQAQRFATGEFNVAVGNGVLANATGNFNVGINGVTGVTSGVGNTGVGTSAGNGVTTGSNNTNIGFRAGWNNNYSGGVNIGRMSGAYEDENNRLYITSIEKFSKSAGRSNAIIYGIMDDNSVNQRLTVNARLGINTQTIDAGLKVNTASAVTFPTTKYLNSVDSISTFVSNASPETVITATPGSLTYATTGNLFLKRTGTGNTGWVNLIPTTTSFSSTPNSVGLSVSSTNQIALHAANKTNPGGVSTTDQEWAGQKMITSDLAGGVTYPLAVKNNLATAAGSGTAMQFLGASNDALTEIVSTKETSGTTMTLFTETGTSMAEQVKLDGVNRISTTYGWSGGDVTTIAASINLNVHLNANLRKKIYYFTGAGSGITLPDPQGIAIGTEFEWHVQFTSGTQVVVDSNNGTYNEFIVNNSSAAPTTNVTLPLGRSSGKFVTMSEGGVMYWKLITY